MSDSVGRNDSPASASDAQPGSTLPYSTIFAYSLPMAGVTAMSMLFSIWLMKFSTDVLLIAPAAMGLIFAAGRIWDAISDPIAGFLSDRSSALRGRRRSWMYASVLPVFITTVMLWSPPRSISSVGLVVWMAVALLLYETAMTIFFVPYGALGMELTERYHERTRLFGYRHVIAAAGAGVGLGLVYLVRTAEDPRLVAFLASVIGGGVMAAMILFSAIKLPEREDFKGRGAVQISRAFTDVLRNPHGRLLFIVYGVETFGAASVAMLAPYVMQYVVNAPEYTELFVLMYFLPQLAFTPMWIRLGRRFSKKNLWLFSMSCMTLGYFTIFFVGQQSFVVLFVVIFLLGLGGGCGAIIAPSIQADVIDYDELITGERKEGAYIAIWNVIRKAGAGVTAALTGLILQWVGYEANVEQSETTKSTMLALISILPGVCYLIGTLLFTRFSLNEREHAEVIVELQRRRREGAGGGG